MTGSGKGLFWSIATVAIIASVAFLYAPFLLGDKTFLHDSLSHATVMGLFFDRLFSGDSLLWSSALNGGHPIWVSLEIVPIFDPVAVIVYTVATIFRLDWLSPYYITTFIWVFLFGIGAALCTQRLTQNHWASLLTFIVLIAGPLALAVPAASNGFLVPFRYLPFVLYFYIRLRQSVTRTSIFCFSSVVAFSLAGYQSVYPFLMYLSLFLIELILRGPSYLAWLWSLVAPRFLWLWSIPLLTLLPTISWLDYTGSLIPIPPNYGHWIAFFFDFEQFFKELFLTYYEVLDTHALWAFWHGTSYIGLLALPLLIIALRTNFLSAAGISWRSTGSDLTVSTAYLDVVLNLWLLSSIILATGALGLREIVEQEKGVLGIRNTGFILIGAALLFAILVGQGLDRLPNESRVLSGLVLDTAIFAFFVLISAYWIVAYVDPNPNLLVMIICLFFLVAVVYRLLARHLDPDLLAASVVALVTIEIMTFSAAAMPALEVYELRYGDGQTHRINKQHWPRLGGTREQLPNRRIYEFSPYDYWPFFLDGPAVFHVSSATTPAVAATPVDFLEKAHTQLFRLRDYDAALNGLLGRAQLEQILGVTRPILEIVPHAGLEGGPDEYRLVTRRTPQAESGKEQGGANTVQTAMPSRPATDEILDMEYAGDRVAIILRLQQESVLIYRDNVAPGWSVSVDGAAAKLLVVDGLNKAVAVPPGEHAIEFRYRPWAYLIGFAIRAVVLLAAGLGCLIIGLRYVGRPTRAR
jgi:hypothetical protein